VFLVEIETDPSYREVSANARRWCEMIAANQRGAAECSHSQKCTRRIITNMPGMVKIQLKGMEKGGRGGLKKVRRRVL